MSTQLSTWNEVRRLADELELQLHLATMEARDRWHELKPRLTALERTFADAGKRAGDAVERELGSVGAALRQLRDDLAPR